jgi:hypothetical protein
MNHRPPPRQTIAAKAFFARAETGALRRFVPGDDAIYNKLAREAGIDPAKLGGRTLPAAFPDGFDVTIQGRTLHIIPVGN